MKTTLKIFTLLMMVMMNVNAQTLSFTYSPNDTIYVGDTVTFTNTSTGFDTTVRWVWNYGDYCSVQSFDTINYPLAGCNDTLAYNVMSSVFQYQRPGEREVTLTALSLSDDTLDVMTITLQILYNSMGGCICPSPPCDLIFNGDFECGAPWNNGGCGAGNNIQANFSSTNPQNICNWFSSNSATPDYYYPCAGCNPTCWVPNSGTGCSPAFTGTAYVGVASLVNLGSPVFSWREYIEQQLNGNTITGSNYQFTIRVRLSDNSHFTTNGLQAVLTTGQINVFNFGAPPQPTPTWQLIDIIPTFLDIPPAAPAATWVTYTFPFTATDNYTHITIGNFKSNPFQQPFLPYTYNNANALNGNFPPPVSSAPGLCNTANCPGNTLMLCPPLTTSHCYFYIDGVELISTSLQNITINNSNPVICLGQGPQSSTLTATPGFTSYSWSPSPDLNTTTGSIVIATPTTTGIHVYTVTVTDANGCTGTASTTVTVYPLPTPSIAPNPAYYCIGSPAISLTVNPAYTSYFWSTFSSGQTIYVNPSPAGSYTYSVLVTDINGCIGTSSATVFSIDPPVANVAANQTRCANDPCVNIGAMFQVVNYLYNWSPSTGLSCTTCANPCANPTTTTTYTLVVTDQNYPANCTASASVTVFVNPNPVITFPQSPYIYCDDGSGINLCPWVNGSPVLTGYNFQWSSNAGSVTTGCANVSPTPSTNSYVYTVTVTDANGCTGTAQAIVNSVPLPTVSISPTTATICQSDQTAIQLTATASTYCSFSWSPLTYLTFPGGPTPATSLTSDAFFHADAPPPPGNYTIIVTATDVNGCTATASVTITVLLFTVPVITGFQNTCIDPITGLPTVYSVPNNYTTYVWNYSGLTSVTFSPNSPNPWEATMDYSTNPSVTGPNAGDISVTVTATNGCSTTVHTPIYQCCNECPAGTINNGIIDLSNLSVSYMVANWPAFTEWDPINNILNPSLNSSPKQVIINGNFIVDDDMTIENAFMVCLGPNARITVNTGQTLTITRSSNFFNILTPACDIMWDGIYLEDDLANLIINGNGSLAAFDFNTLISGAKNSVVSNDGGHYDIEFTNFYNNNKDIIANANQGFHLGSVVGSKFESPTGTLLPYYVGINLQTPLPRTNIGIEINSVDQIHIGDAQFGINTFDNMDIGIKSTNSGVIVKNNSFLNIYSITPPCTPPGPNYICPVQGTAIFATGKTNWLLNNCYLHVGGYNANEPNSFNNCQNGIQARTNIEVLAYNNTMTNFNSPYFQSFGYLPSTAISVSGNKLKQINISDNHITNFSNGISCRFLMNRWFVASVNTVIGNNILQDGSKVGIWVGNVSGATILPTNISSNVFIFGNIPVSNPQPQIKNVTTGVIISQLRKAQVHDLYIQFTDPLISNSKFGIRAWSNSIGSTVSHNKVEYFTSNFINIALENSLRGITVETSPATNVLNNTLKRMGTGIRCFGTSLNSRLYCNEMYENYVGVGLASTTIGDQGSQAPDNPSDNSWTGTNSHSNIRDITRTGGTQPNWYYRNIPNPSILYPQLLPNIINDMGFNSNASYLCHPPALLAPEWREKELGPIVRGTLQFSENADENWYNVKVYAYRILIVDTSLMYLGDSDDALYQQFYDSMRTTNAGMIEEVYRLLALGDTAAAREINNGITEDFTLDANQKIVNEIYMETIEQGVYEFDETQTQTLTDIATQSPLTGGTGVYDARLMLGLDLDDEANENFKIDSPAGSDIQRSFVIYPNPNDGNMQMDYVIETDKSATFELFDYVGKKLDEQTLPGGKHSLIISRKDLSNGIYYCKVRVNNDAVYNGKIVIIK